MLFYTSNADNTQKAWTYPHPEQKPEIDLHFMAFMALAGAAAFMARRFMAAFFIAFMALAGAAAFMARRFMAAFFMAFIALAGAAAFIAFIAFAMMIPRIELEA